MWPTAHQHFAFVLDQFEKARQSVENALDSVVEAEMAKLAKRFPKRRIELHSGMGTTQLIIRKRKPFDAFDEWHWDTEGEESSSHNWPEFIEEPAADMWSAIRLYQDEVADGKDPGFGVIIYDNGKRIKGLPAGGAVR